MAFDPSGVVFVVMVAQLNEHRRGPGLTHLSDGGGGLRTHSVGQGIDGLEVGGHNVCCPLAVGAAGVVEHNNAPGSAVIAGGGGVGVQGQMEIISTGVGRPDGRRGGHIRCVSNVLNSGWNHKIISTNKEAEG